MSASTNSSNSPWWIKLFCEEKRWLSRLSREGQIGDLDHPHIRKQRELYIIVSTAIVLIRPRPIWKFSGKWFFVSFGTDELCHASIRSNPERYESLNFGWRAVFKGSQLGIVLNSLYLLINHPCGIPRRVRKHLLAWHFHYLKHLLPQLNRNVFLVKQDYFGPSSLLVTLSWHQSLHVAGIQHGLMDAKNIQQRKLYPGIRTRIEFAYDDFYRGVFSQVKPPSTIAEVLGPPYDCIHPLGSRSGTARVVFISSGQMRSEEGRAIINNIRSLADGDGLAFLLRPHPSEKDIEQLNEFQIDDSPPSCIFNANPESTVFVGIFSSLMYQAAFKGFRTLWLLNGSKVVQNHRPFLSNLPNAALVSQNHMVAGMLSSYLILNRMPVCIDPAQPRLTALLEKFYPEILE